MAGGVLKLNPGSLRTRGLAMNKQTRNISKCMNVVNFPVYFKLPISLVGLRSQAIYPSLCKFLPITSEAGNQDKGQKPP